MLNQQVLSKNALSQRDFVNIEFIDLTYKVPGNRKEKQVILDHVSGNFKSGELTAIIGSSGSGKTTLLNVLSGFKYAPSSGKILINDQPKQNEQFKKVSRYIVQESHNLLSNSFTVQEIMFIAANLKLGKVSLEYKHNTINDILIKLRLDASRQTMTNKLSGGERKRLSIGLELINNPLVLFLDEPTTGLDYYSTSHCISLLRTLANSGTAIICSLHAATAPLLLHFNNVYVLASGKCTYQGKSNDIISYLANINLNCPSHYDPIDYMLEVCNGDYGDHNDQLVTLVQNGQKIFNKKQVINIMQPEVNLNKSPYTISQHDSKWLDHFQILTIRMSLENWRNKKSLIFKLLAVVIVSLLVGLTYKGMAQEGSQTISVYLSFYAFIGFDVFYYGMIGIVQFFGNYKTSQMELFNNWYNLSAYYSALTVSTLWFHLMSNSISVLISYLLMEFPLELNRLLMYFTVHFLTGLIFESFAYILGTITVQLVITKFIFTCTYAFFNLVLLYEIQLFPQLSAIMKFFVTTNFLTYSFKGMVSSLLENRPKLNCATEFCIYSDLNKFLNDIGTGGIVWWIDIVTLTVILFVLKIVGYYIFKIKITRRML